MADLPRPGSVRQGIEARDDDVSAAADQERTNSLFASQLERGRTTDPAFRAFDDKQAESD
jgi:hypothetical protein